MWLCIKQGTQIGYLCNSARGDPPPHIPRPFVIQHNKRHLLCSFSLVLVYEELSSRKKKVPVLVVLAIILVSVLRRNKLSGLLLENP
ncbi:hypothetical protein HAX54_031541 [Datura stramonium]|uniref:Uncharacterized protein n=1 Tax=Datura stramonium TaxID=4076 RepID=A0ABS8RGR0_DATST|nr:hypothetical protein [Datura stramonium]